MKNKNYFYFLFSIFLLSAFVLLRPNLEVEREFVFALDCPIKTIGLSRETYNDLKSDSNIINEVKALQTIFSKIPNIGWQADYKATGSFGYGTEGLLRRFQKAYGLNSSGIVDEATRDKLCEIWGYIFGEKPSEKIKTVPSSVKISGGLSKIPGGAEVTGSRVSTTIQPQKQISTSGAVVLGNKASSDYTWLGSTPKGISADYWKKYGWSEGMNQTFVSYVKGQDGLSQAVSAPGPFMGGVYFGTNINRDWLMQNMTKINETGFFVSALKELGGPDHNLQRGDATQGLSWDGTGVDYVVIYGGEFGKDGIALPGSGAINLGSYGTWNADTKYTIVAHTSEGNIIYEVQNGQIINKKTEPGGNPPKYNITITGDLNPEIKPNGWRWPNYGTPTIESPYKGSDFLVTPVVREGESAIYAWQGLESGGYVYLIYPDGSVKNISAELGYGKLGGTGTITIPSEFLKDGVVIQYSTQPIRPGYDSDYVRKLVDTKVTVIGKDDPIPLPQINQFYEELSGTSLALDNFWYAYDRSTKTMIFSKNLLESHSPGIHVIDVYGPGGKITVRFYITSDYKIENLEIIDKDYIKPPPGEKLPGYPAPEIKISSTGEEKVVGKTVDPKTGQIIELKSSGGDLKVERGDWLYKTYIVFPDGKSYEFTGDSISFESQKSRYPAGEYKIITTGPGGQTVTTIKVEDIVDSYTGIKTRKVTTGETKTEDYLGFARDVNMVKTPTYDTETKNLRLSYNTTIKATQNTDKIKIYTYDAEKRTLVLQQEISGNEANLNLPPGDYIIKFVDKNGITLDTYEKVLLEGEVNPLYKGRMSNPIIQIDQTGLKSGKDYAYLSVQAEGASKVTVTDKDGNIIYSTTSDKFQAPVHNLKDGSYFINIYDIGGNVITRETFTIKNNEVTDQGRVDGTYTVPIYDKNFKKIGEQVIVVKNGQVIEEKSPLTQPSSQTLPPREIKPPPQTSPEIQACLLKDTEILLANLQTKKIQDIKIGEKVMGFDEQTYNYLPVKVLRTFRHQTDSYFILELENEGKLRVTGNHPIFVNNSYSSVDSLKIGDSVLTTNGFQKVKSIKLIKESTEVFNLEVDNSHNYFANRILVHNKIAPSATIEPRVIPIPTSPPPVPLSTPRNESGSDSSTNGSPPQTSPPGDSSGGGSSGGSTPGSRYLFERFIYSLRAFVGSFFDFSFKK